MTDLTAITTPFGLLDLETQEALKAHGGPWECYTGSCGWAVTAEPSWVGNAAYRVKPAPPKPREWLLNPEGRGVLSVDPDNSHDVIPSGWVHVREVLE